MITLTFFFFKPGLQWVVLLNESVKSFLSVSTELVLFMFEETGHCSVRVLSQELATRPY